MTVDFNPNSGAATAQSQASLLMLNKSLKLEQQRSAQLLQSISPASPPAPRPGPAVSGMGQTLDAFG